MSAALSLRQSAQLLGRYRYVELSLFVLLGERAGHCGSDQLTVFCHSASRAHGRRALLVEGLFPNGPVLSEERWTKSPGSEFDAALTFLSGMAADEDFAEGLGGVYSAVSDGYERHLERAVGPGDAALRGLLSVLVVDTTARISGVAQLGPGQKGDVARRVGELLSWPGAFGHIPPEVTRPGQPAGGRA